MSHRSLFCSIAVLIAVVAVAPGHSARADLILSLVSSSEAFLPGQEGSVEILATAAGSDVEIALFQATLTGITPGAPLTWGTATEPASNYVFGTDGVGIFGADGPDLGTFFVTDELFEFVPPADPVLISAGSTVSLGVVSFTINPDAPLLSTFTIGFSADLFETFYTADNAGNVDPIAFSQLGQLRINVIPEPSSIALAGLGGLFVIGGLRTRFRRRAA